VKPRRTPRLGDVEIQALGDQGIQVRFGDRLDS
jgi:hypothetical protein